MYCGKYKELERNKDDGTYYSIWIEAEDKNGAEIDFDVPEAIIQGDVYNDYDEALSAIREEFFQTNVSYDFLQQHPGAAWMATYLEENEFVNGIDLGSRWNLGRIELNRNDGWNIEDDMMNRGI